MENQMTLKIYLYNTKRKPRKVFTICADISFLFNLLDKIYMQIERGNTDYIKAESAIFRKSDFAFAMIV